MFEDTDSSKSHDLFKNLISTSSTLNANNTFDALALRDWISSQIIKFEKHHQVC